jgi:hypothetical protein
MHINRAKRSVYTRIITYAEVPYSSKKLYITSHKIDRSKWCFCVLCNFSLNSLTAKSVLAGSKNSRSEGVLLAKHLKHTAHKHHHHDGAVCSSIGMVLMGEHTPPPGASLQGVGRGRR